MRLAPRVRGGLAFSGWRASDLDALAALVADSETMRSVGGALRRDEVAGLLDRYRRDDDPSLLAVRVADGDEVIGSGLLRFQGDAVEIGFVVRRDRWGRGHGTCIARMLVELARELAPGAAVVARVALANVGSVRVLERAGLVVPRDDTHEPVLARLAME